MKEGKVWDEVHAFLLLYPRQLYGPFSSSHYSLPTVALAAASRRKVWLESFAPFEVSVRDSGSNRRKKLIRLCLIPSLALFVPPPPEVICFILFFFYTDYILPVNKSRKKTTTLLGYKINQLVFFFICLSHNKQERLHFSLWIVRTVSRHWKYNKFSYRV